MSGCELGAPAGVLIENEAAYVRYDGNPLSRGHVLVVSKRHVADFFEMNGAEHLIPRYTGDVPDPGGGIRCVLKK